MIDNINILVVDDDSVILMSAERALSPEGYTVEGVLSGKEAMRKIEQNDYDLVLTDIRMPDIDGITLIRWIRQFRPAIGIVIITANLLQETVKQAIKLGVIEHMMKPFTPEMLKDVINRTIEQIRGNTSGNNPEEKLPLSMFAELDKLFHQYRKKPSSLILLLLHAQEIFGYLSPLIQERIARGLNIYPSEIHSIVSSYSCFRTKPGGDHTPCYISGSERVLWGMIPKTGRRVTDAVSEYIKWIDGQPEGETTTADKINIPVVDEEPLKEFTPPMLAELDKMIHQYRKESGSALPVLPVLLRAQEIFGYLPAAIQKHIARGLNIYPSEIHSIVSSHSIFRTKPGGDHTIRVCLCTECYVKGSERVLNSIKETLKIDVGETTRDRKFTLDAGRCVHACGRGPVMVIDHDTHSALTRRKAINSINKYSPISVSAPHGKGGAGAGKEMYDA